MNGLIACCQGRIGRVSELKRVKGGELPMVSFSVAVGDGDTTQWVKVCLFGEQAEALAPKLIPGAECYVEGRLHLNLWKGRDGETRATLELSAWTTQLMRQIGKRRPKQPRAPSKPAGTWMPPAPEVRDFDDPLNF